MYFPPLWIIQSKSLKSKIGSFKPSKILLANLMVIYSWSKSCMPNSGRICSSKVWEKGPCPMSWHKAANWSLLSVYLLSIENEGFFRIYLASKRVPIECSYLLWLWPMKYWMSKPDCLIYCKRWKYLWLIVSLIQLFSESSS